MGIWNRKPLRVSLILAAAILILIPATPVLLNWYANWLIVEEPIAGSGSANGAVALSGADGERLLAAIELIREGRAENLLIVGPDAPLLRVYTGGHSLSQGEAKRRIAVKKGVPEERALLALGATSTYEEAETVLREIQTRGWTSVYVVTSPLHTRRARATFRKVLANADAEIGIHHLPLGRSAHDPNRWWRRESDTMAVTTETLKLGYYIYRYRIWPWG